MRIFFCGFIASPWMTAWQRSQSFKELGHTVIDFQQDGYLKHSLAKGFLKYFTKNYYAFSTREIKQFSQDFIARIVEAKPDIAWMDKVLFLMPETLKKAKKLLPNCTFVCYQEDDPFGFNIAELPCWKYFIDAIPYYDFHFVKREINIQEFIERGANQVHLCPSGYYSGIFKPMFQAEERTYIHDVSFVGNARDRRISDIRSLILDQKLPVEIYGKNWERTLVYHLKRSQFHPPVYSQDYVSLISQSKISLGYVSAANRDEFTNRTFEIPACGAFFLAQRTSKHLEFYEEGKEAEFFDSPEECADKIRFYLNHNAAREKIAKAGYQRCLNSGYRMHDRLNKALAQIELCRQ